MRVRFTKRFKILFLISITLVGPFGSSTIAAPAFAHTPDGTWTCHGGEPRDNNNGQCFYHWPDAQRSWHFVSGFPAGPQNAIRAGRNTITDGHALNAPEDGASPNHVYWDTVCGIACTISDSTDAGAQHLLGFQLHFDSSYGWNLNTALGHGQFTGLDLWMVAAHEWGHAVGMGHSYLVFGHDCFGSGSVENGWATMTQGDCLVGGHTEQRTLHTQDWYGRCQIYSHAHGYACP